MDTSTCTSSTQVHQYCYYWQNTDGTRDVKIPQSWSLFTDEPWRFVHRLFWNQNCMLNRSPWTRANVPIRTSKGVATNCMTNASSSTNLYANKVRIMVRLPLPQGKRREVWINEVGLNQRTRQRMEATHVKQPYYGCNSRRARQRTR